MVAAISGYMTVRHAGRAKFTYGKCHMTEHGTGILFAGFNAFLIGNTILSGLDQILCRTYNAYHRENTQGNRQIALPCPV